MKKRFLVLLIASFVLLLAACGGPSEEVLPIVSKGDKAMEQKDYKEAIKNYAQAYNKDHNDQVFSKLTEARKARFDELLVQYHAKDGELRYSVAKKLAEEAQTMTGIGTDDDYEKISKDIKRFTGLIADQKLLDDYILWSKPYVLNLQKSSNQWLNAIAAYKANRMSSADLQNLVSGIIATNEAMLSDMDTKSLNIDPSFSDAHAILLKIVTNNQSSYSGVYGALADGKDKDVVATEGEGANEAKQDINTFITALRTYAKDHNLRDTFAETVVQDTK